MRLLLIEDESGIHIPLKKALERKDYSVDLATDGKEGLQKAQLNSYDCIILDINLPNLTGLEVCQKLRESNVNTPTIMLTARSQQLDKIAGLESGADDYLTKPFDFKELLLRIQALIRRGSENSDFMITLDELKLDTNAKKVFKGTDEIELNRKEYGVLEYLLRNQGKPISQEELLEHVWDQDIDELSQTVRTTVKTLRQKVDPDKKLIKTRRGIGYVIG